MSIRQRILDRAIGTVVDPVVHNIDVDDVVQRIDVDDLLDRIDVNALLDRVDPDRLLDRVDPNRLLDRVDPNALLDRVDPDRLLERVDPNALLDRVDADRLLDRVDVNRLMDRTQLGAIIARSTTGVFAQVLDNVRTKIIAIDQVAQGAAGYVIRRRRSVPATPSDPGAAPDLSGMSLRHRAVALQGHHAGSVSRFIAFLLDQFVLGVLFALGWALVSSAVEVVIGRPIDLLQHRWLVAVSYFLWALTYTAVPLAVVGRTIGKGVLGLMVVRFDGHDLAARRALTRTLCFPISFLLFGFGLIIGLFRKDRRELHDLIAGTAVIYAWDATTAELRAEST
ncbi:MAG TPA: RDD family protein [Acidimicrobiales bacterium]